MPTQTTSLVADAPSAEGRDTRFFRTPVDPVLQSYDGAIDAFWAWLGGAASSLAQDPTGETVQDLTARLRLIHPELSVTFAPSRQARLCLAVTANGGVALRLLCGRIAARGTVLLPDLEVLSARPRASVIHGAVVRLGEHALALDVLQATVRLDPAAELLDLTVFHPGLESLDKATRDAALLLLLDSLLGEDDVRMWVGRAQVGRVPAPESALSSRHIRGQVDRLKDVATADQWALLERPASQGQPAQILLVNRALKRLHHPRFGTRLRVTLSLKDPREDGLLRSGERQRIDRLEDRLDHAIGRDGVKTGVATADGKHTLTWFVDPDAAVDGRVDALLQPRSWSASVETELDLDWADRV